MWFLTGRRLEERLHTPNTSVSHLLRLFGTSRCSFTHIRLTGLADPRGNFAGSYLDHPVTLGTNPRHPQINPHVVRVRAPWGGVSWDSKARVRGLNGEGMNGVCLLDIQSTLRTFSSQIRRLPTAFNPSMP